MVQTFTKRPTSPLLYEPLYVPAEEILYPGSDEEATPDEREKKRLRVEIQGQQYLNGRPLFIQSAGLRGPFDNGWVNPWASKKRKYGIDDIRRFPEAGTEAFPRRLHVEARPSTARKRSVAVSGYGSLDYSSDNGVPLVTEASRQEEVTAKRRRHGELDESHGYHNSQRKMDQEAAAPKINWHYWLKTDKAYPQARLRGEERSSTPTPAAKPRSKSHATPSSHPEHFGRAITLPLGSKYQNGLSQSKEDALNNGNANKKTTSAPSEGAQVETVEIATTDLRPGAIDPDHGLSSNYVRERSISKIDIATKYGYDEAKRLTQRAVRRAEVEDGQLQAKKLSQEAVVRAIESNQRSAPSRLTPYLSEAILENDAASSAAFRAAKAPKPKPSPHAVPSSTHQPEFQYRYTRKGTSTSTSPQRAPFVDAPEQPQARPRSASSSSSGSSAFAEALEAAQEKAAIKPPAPSKSSSPAIEGPETKSVKKNRQALKRLTFTPSGGAKLASTRTSSRPSSDSAAGLGKIDMKHQDKPPPNEPPSLQRTSTKSSARSLTNGNRSRNSIIFPEAQMDPIAHPPLAQAPSGPSTNLLETDKQSPKIPSFDEGDSYLDLSTQAAVLKAQRSFQADVVSAFTPRRPKKEKSSPIDFTSGKAGITPMAHGRRETEAANAQLIKSSDSDDEEPMSTQAMVDAISPFAVTTIKKRPADVQKRTSVIPSPIKKKKAHSPSPAPILSPESPTIGAFRTNSPGMSTSQSSSPSPSPSPEKSPPPIPLSHPTTNSKPPSSLTSFSILPNGTLTETSIYQQDGQQQQDIPDYDISLPLDPFGFDDAGGDGQRRGDTWDLNAAIEEAGSFLGDWDVEAEARKEGDLSRKRESGNRGILKGSA